MTGSVPADEPVDPVSLALDLTVPDPGAADKAREAAAGAAPGRLGELAAWWAAARGEFPAAAPARVRLVLAGPPDDPVSALAERSGVGVGVVALDGADVTACLAAGVAAADAEIDAGADLLVVAVADETAVPAALTSVITDVEPTALLPRGAGAVDTERWVERAIELRALRRRLTAGRGDPQLLLEIATHHAPDGRVAVLTGLLLRAAARRTPALLDGPAVLAAAVLARDVDARCVDWWQVADTAGDVRAAPVAQVASETLGLRPVLDLGASRGDGTAGLLVLPVLQAAAGLGGTA